MKRILFLVCFIFFSLFSHAGYKVIISPKNLKGEKLYFGYFIFSEKAFAIRDSVEIKSDSAIILSYNKSIYGGMYQIAFKNNTQKFLVNIKNNETVALALEKKNNIISATSKNKIDQLYFEEQLQDIIYKRTYDSLKLRAKTVSLPWSKDSLRLYSQKEYDKLTKIRSEILSKTNDSSLLYQTIKINQLIDASNYISNKEEIRDSLLKITNFNDKKLFISPLLQKVLFKYFSLYKLEADSINIGIEKVMNKVNCSSPCYNSVVDFFSRLCQNRNIINSNESFAFFVENYILTNSCAVLDSTKKKDMIKKLEAETFTLLNKIPRNLIAVDSATNKYSLLDSAKNHDFTFLIFYSPACSHCQEEIPKLNEMINDFENTYNKNVLRFTIVNEVVPNWQKDTFLVNHNLNKNWLDLSLNLETNKEDREYFNAYTNPLIYVLDNKGVLIGKKLNSKSAKTLLLEKIK